MLVLALLFCVIVSSTYTYDVPLALWSGKDFIKGEHVGVSNYVTETDIEILLRSLIHKQYNIGTLSQYVDSTYHPEVLVIFAEAQLRSEQLSTYASSLLKFREILRSAESSLQAPFVDMPTAFDIHLVNVVKSVHEAQGDVFYLGKGSPLLKDILNRDPNTIVTTVAAMENTLKKNEKIFSNGKTDIIIVYLSTMTESSGKFKVTDSVISDIHGLISSQTDDYVCVYTGLAFDNPEYNVDFGSKQTSSRKRHISSMQAGNDTAPAPAPEISPSPAPMKPNATNNGTVPVFRQFFGGWFWELFVCMIVMLPFLIIGTYAIDSIQTPIFESKKKN
jgi:hypothetical protein